jgi:hypothetical protein
MVVMEKDRVHAGGGEGLRIFAMTWILDDPHRVSCRATSAVLQKLIQITAGARSMVEGGGCLKRCWWLVEHVKKLRSLIRLPFFNQFSYCLNTGKSGAFLKSLANDSNKLLLLMWYCAI